MIELLYFLVGLSAGAWGSWTLTGHHYRKLIAELIDRNCKVIAEMRADQQQEQTNSSAA